jgi:hypothetical protein
MSAYFALPTSAPKKADWSSGTKTRQAPLSSIDSGGGASFLRRWRVSLSISTFKQGRDRTFRFARLRTQLLIYAGLFFCYADLDKPTPVRNGARETLRRPADDGPAKKP